MTKSIVLSMQQDIMNGHTAEIYEDKIICNGSKITLVSTDEMIRFLINTMEFIQDGDMILHYPKADDPDDLRYKITR